MNEDENKREYEMSFLLTPEILEGGLDFETAELKKIIRESGGEVGRVVESGSPKKRWLSYEIKKQRQAYFGVLYFKMPSEGVSKIKSILSSNKKILRFLILSSSPVKLTPQLRSDDKSVNINSELKPTNEQSFESKLESILKG